MVSAGRCRRARCSGGVRGTARAVGGPGLARRPRLRDRSARAAAGHSKDGLSAMLVIAVAWRGVAWRGVAWRGVAWRGGSGHGPGCLSGTALALGHRPGGGRDRRVRGPVRGRESQSGDEARSPTDADLGRVPGCRLDARACPAVRPGLPATRIMRACGGCAAGHRPGWLRQVLAAADLSYPAASVGAAVRREMK